MRAVGEKPDVFFDGIVLIAKAFTHHVSFTHLGHLGRPCINEPVVADRIIKVAIGVDVAHEHCAMLDAEVAQLLCAEVIIGFLLCFGPG